MLSPGYILKDTYVVETLHARGGMALVYRVRHAELGVTRALKVLQPQFAKDADFAQRFRREAQLMAQLRHPNIAEVYDFGSTPQGWLYLIMEWLEGEDLQQVLRRQPRLSVETVAALSQQIAAALTLAHTAGVTHRDLKPGNILLDRGSSGPQVKVVDFGIARIRTDGSPQTLPGIVMGTPGYMAPEQILGSGDTTGAHSDQFALGVMLYEMLLGARLFCLEVVSAEALCGLAIRMAQLELPPLPIENLVVRSRVEQVLRRAMASAPNQRFPSVAELDAAFQEALDLSLRPPSVSVELMPLRRDVLPRSRTYRSLLMVGYGLVACSFVAAVTVSLSNRGRRSSDQTNLATARFDGEIQDGITALSRSSSSGDFDAESRGTITALSQPSSSGDRAKIIEDRPSNRRTDRSSPSAEGEKLSGCKRLPATTISVVDDPPLSAGAVREVQQVVTQCIRSTKVRFAPSRDIVLARTSFLHVMSGLDIQDKDLLEHCLRTKFVGRAPRRIMIKQRLIKENSCNEP
jgi:serine/threonine protein kinase